MTLIKCANFLFADVTDVKTPKVFFPVHIPSQFHHALSHALQTENSIYIPPKGPRSLSSFVNCPAEEDPGTAAGLSENQATRPARKTSWLPKYECNFTFCSSLFFVPLAQDEICDAKRWSKRRAERNFALRANKKTKRSGSRRKICLERIKRKPRGGSNNRDVFTLFEQSWTFFRAALHDPWSGDPRTITISANHGSAPGAI